MRRHFVKAQLINHSESFMGKFIGKISARLQKITQFLNESFRQFLSHRGLKCLPSKYISPLTMNNGHIFLDIDKTLIFQTATPRWRVILLGVGLFVACLLLVVTLFAFFMLQSQNSYSPFDLKSVRNSFNNYKNLVRIKLK